MNNYFGGYIDPKKIIEKKKTRIQKDYEYLTENYNPLNSIDFLNKVRKYPLNEILENSHFIHMEPRGTDFLNYVLKMNDLNPEDIQMQKVAVNKSLQNKNISESHLSKLNECLNILQEKEEKYNSIEYIKESTKFNLITSNIPKPIIESTVINDMDMIIQNINYQPEIIEKYEEMIREIKKWKGKTILSNFIPVLLKNTSLIIGLTVLIVGSAITLVVSLPLILVSKLIEERIDRKYISSFIYVISKEIKKVEELMTSSDQRKRKMLEDYSKSLKSAREKLLKYEIYARKFKGVREHIGQMSPIGQYDTIAQLEEEIDGLIKDAESELTWEPVVETLIEEIECIDDRTKEKFAELYIGIKDFILNHHLYKKIFSPGNPNLDTKEAVMKGDQCSVSGGLSQIVFTNIITEEHPIKLVIEIMNNIFEKFDFVELQGGYYCHKDFPSIHLIFELGYSNTQNYTKFNINIYLRVIAENKKIYPGNFYKLSENGLSLECQDKDTKLIKEKMLDKFIKMGLAIKNYVLSDPKYNKIFSDKLEDINKVNIEKHGNLINIAKSKLLTHPFDNIVSNEVIRSIANKFNFIEVIPGIYRHYEYTFIELTSSINIYIKESDNQEVKPESMVLINLIFNTSTEAIDVAMRTLENAVYIKLTDFIFDENEDKCLESFKGITDLLEKYSKVLELKQTASDARNSLSRRVALKVEDATKKSINKLRDIKTKGQHTTAVLKRVPAHIDNFINDVINKVKEMDKTERRNRIIEGTFRKKILKVIRNAIVLGAEWAISPALAGITLLTGVALDKNADKKVRNQILQELQLELRIVEEKLEDSRSDGKRKKKYELMRIKNKLEQEIDRIRYNL